MPPTKKAEDHVMAKALIVGERYYHYCKGSLDSMEGWGVVSEVGPLRSQFVFEDTEKENSVDNRCLYTSEKEAHGE
jgi:hypothetical protein